MRRLECGLIILPPPELDAEIRRWQAGFPPAYVPPFPPHLTLKGLYRCLTSRALVEGEIGRVCGESEPFVVTVDGLDCFCDAVESLFYLKVAPSQALTALHLALVAALTPLTALSGDVQPGYEGENYLPHLTMLRGVPAAELDTVRAALAGAHPSATFTVRSVALECHLPGQQWRARRSFPLGPRQRRLPAVP